jgi:hypothetical protein
LRQPKEKKMTGMSLSMALSSFSALGRETKFELAKIVVTPDCGMDLVSPTNGDYVQFGEGALGFFMKTQPCGRNDQTEVLMAWKGWVALMSNPTMIF